MKQLVWNSRRDGGIELEVTRRDGSKCHEGSINQLVADDDGQLFSIGKSSILLFTCLRQSQPQVYKLSLKIVCMLLCPCWWRPTDVGSTNIHLVLVTDIVMARLDKIFNLLQLPFRE